MLIQYSAIVPKHWDILLYWYCFKTLSKWIINQLPSPRFTTNCRAFHIMNLFICFTFNFCDILERAPVQLQQSSKWMYQQINKIIIHNLSSKGHYLVKCHILDSICFLYIGQRVNKKNCFNKTVGALVSRLAAELKLGQIWNLLKQFWP